MSGGIWGRIMNNREIDGIIAEKMMGWWLYNAGDYPLSCWMNSVDEVVVDQAEYKPTINIAQAIEAIEQYCKSESKLFILRYSSPEPWRLSLGDGEGLLVAVTYGNTPALAICEALVKAVSDD